VKRDAERARRFDLHLSLRYRSVGAKSWREGRIENISRSGVLFWTERLLHVDTPLEMRFVLPLGRTSSRIVCRGRIVRAVRPRGGEAPRGLAATISNYRFVRSKPSLPTGSETR
jgi:PilZ domain-containing protein